MSTHFPQRRWAILAIAAGAALLWHQEAGRRQLAAEVDVLNSRLATRRDAAQRPQDGRPEALTGLERQPIDWEGLAAKLNANPFVAGGLLNKNARLWAALEWMSVDDLTALLDQIAAADLSEKERDVLEMTLASVLAKKSPETTFTRFTVVGRSDWSFFLGDLYQEWVKHDSEAAVAWLQRHVATGGYYFQRMISTPFFGVLTSAPGTSAGILAVVPPQGRLESLRSLEVGVLKNSGQKEWAYIVRNVIPEADRAEAITWPLGNWSDGDGAPMRLDQVEAYLERIGASQAEWDACVMTVSGTNGSWVTTTQAKQGTYGDETQKFHQMLEWVSEHAPGMREAATLRGLGEIARDGDLNVASERALEFYKASGNDAYLCRVLDQANDLSNAADVRAMIERLSDPALQARYQKEHASILKGE